MSKKKKSVESAPVKEKQKDFTIVLNGGSSRMDDATVPVKWFFSPEFIEKEPRYILLVDLDRTQLKSQNQGRRRVCSVDEVVTFIQMHRSGQHLMLALAFRNREDAVAFLERDPSCYKYAIDPESIKEGSSWGSALAVTSIEFEVPKELFAQPPTSKLGKLWWKYLFWPNAPKATDECQVRKLAWFFSLPKLPIFILAKILLVVAFILYALYIVLARPVSLFIGWWPITREKSLNWIRYPRGNKWNMDVRQDCYLEIWRKGEYTGNHMMISPLVATIFIVLLGATIFFMVNMSQDNFNFLWGVLTLFGFVLIPQWSGLLKNFIKADTDDRKVITTLSFFGAWFLLSILGVFFTPEESPARYVASLGLVVGLGIIFIVIFFASVESLKEFFSGVKSKRKRLAEERARLLEAKERLTYKKYLQAFIVPEEKVTLKNLPGTFESSKLKRDARIKFWTTKTKICRPYES